MKYKIIFQVAIATLLCTSVFAQNGDDLPPKLDEYITKVLQTFKVPGMSVSIVKDGKVLLAKGFGVKKFGEQAPVDEHTLFSIASNSKAFTATALALLVEDGKLKWDDPVINYLPWFRMSDPYVTMHLTVRDLLVHHSGIGAYSGDYLIFPPSTYTRKEIVSKVARLPMAHDFRTTYAYDNILYLAAGEVISAVSNMEWEDFVKTRILDKIGMNETTTRFSQMKSQPNVSSAHIRYKDTVRVLEHYSEQAIGDAGDPAGGIASNATDIAEWMITQLDSGKTQQKIQLFKPTTTKELWKIVRPIPIEKISPEIAPAQMDFWGYALGFRSYNYQRHKIVGHGGKLDGFVSQVVMIPDLKMGITVLTNQESTGAYWSVIYHVLDYYMHNKSFDWIAGYKKMMDSSIAKSKSGQIPVILPDESTVKPPLPDEKYEGTYRDAVYGDLSITKESTGLVLRFTHTPQFTADLKYFQHDTFVAKFRNPDLRSDSYVTFALNPDGSIDQVKLKIIDPDSDSNFNDLLFKSTKK